MEVVRLRSSEIVSTLEVLSRRINERFPDAGLGESCSFLLQVSKTISERLDAVNKPIRFLRLGVILGLSLLAFIFSLFAVRAHITFGELTAYRFIIFTNSFTSVSITVGAALYSLVTYEKRVRRKRARRALDELRSLAHVIDMHQLTKDPERMRTNGKDTLSSPSEDMTPYEMGRYLDYCCEMLSLVGKIAAMYAIGTYRSQGIDRTILGYVNDIETLTSGLARKIFQKMMILHSFYFRRVPGIDLTAEQ